MNSHKMLISFIPWVALTLVAGHAGAGFVGWAAALAGLLTLGIVISGMSERTANGSRSTLKIIDAAGVVIFAAMAALAFTGSPDLREHIVDYGRGACVLVLALVMLGSLLVVPFTEQYARESVPRQYWHSPVFRAINRRISAVFGVAVLVGAACHLSAGYLTASGHLTRAANLALNWAIPVLAVLAALKYVNRARSASAGTSA